MVVPFRAGPKFYADNRRADLLLKTFLEGLDFPDKGKLTVFFLLEVKEDKKSKSRDEGRSRRSAFDKPWPLIVTGFSEDFGKFLLWHQCFATASHSPSLGPSPAFQGNVVNDDPELITEALACIKAATWHDTSIQNLVKRITQSQGCSGNPAKLTVMMTQSWRLSYIETKNFDDDKGPVFLLTGAPIMNNLNMHRAITAHIRRLRIRVNFQQLINIDKIIGCNWCKNQNHLSHACLFLEVDSTWYGPSTDELRLRLFKTDTPKPASQKRKEDSTNLSGHSKRGKKNDNGWREVRHAPSLIAKPEHLSVLITDDLLEVRWTAEQRGAIQPTPERADGAITVWEPSFSPKKSLLNGSILACRGKLHKINTVLTVLASHYPVKALMYLLIIPHHKTTMRVVTAGNQPRNS
ncbi:hypothetical protein EDD18DRAFT_1401892 [Armillaria luteobubalina]|uniref:Uncharacterized protein n=1 Tax=Armillaria luteobubalina TaxID=153913 RepID=A0AA39Q0Y4_9AGAR|nr:hypothetical protein EDD18DRAFT_1401892 [Armillaria luteobubalina]